MAPSYFTVEWGEPSGFIEGEGTFTLVDIGFDATDPRASGLFTIADATVNTMSGDTSYDVVAQSVRLTNEGGTWTGTAEGLGTSEVGGGVTIWKLQGAGSYEGLHLLMVSALEGPTWAIIVPAGSVPSDFPELPAESAE